jgi:hypothetical protein
MGIHQGIATGERNLATYMMLLAEGPEVIENAKALIDRKG